MIQVSDVDNNMKNNINQQVLVSKTRDFNKPDKKS